MAAQVEEKTSTLARTETKFANVLQLLEQANIVKDLQAGELRDCILERDQYRAQLEKLNDKHESEASTHRKEVGKAEKDRARAESELTEARAKSSRLEERVLNLNKIVENLEFQLKESAVLLSTAKQEQEADLRQHVSEMAEKEKKLQEFFCKKLDRKLARVDEQHRKAVEDLINNNQH